MRHHIMARFWWILAARGTVGILLGSIAFWNIGKLENFSPDLFGMSLFMKPASVLASLILLLGAYALLDGVFSILLGLQDFGAGKRWVPLVLEGVASSLLGIFTWAYPGNTVLLALYGIAVWAFLTGLLEIRQGLDLNEYRDRRPFFISAGVLSLLFGSLVLTFRMGGVGLIWALGTYAFLFGSLLLVLALRLHRYLRIERAS